jgi:type IV pilus biogenesis protein CpaD/CtpE
VKEQTDTVTDGDDKTGVQRRRGPDHLRTLPGRRTVLAVLAVLILVAGCATSESPSGPAGPDVLSTNRPVGFQKSAWACDQR